MAKNQGCDRIRSLELFILHKVKKMASADNSENLNVETNSPI
ncbi:MULTISPECIES: hypothetical protein [Cyanophyceae]|nr:MULTISPECIES: hypothetical protein [unclassified Trichocoleus]